MLTDAILIKRQKKEDKKRNRAAFSKIRKQHFKEHS